jgi:nitroimidazol reductase NimA-like FMN-containing flavoprotein (pyridoxamine 5'-phosphate oxidase superfamily)
MSLEPQTSLDSRFSTPGAEATPWSDVERLLAEAELFWIATVRPDGGVHVTPLGAIWMDNALYFTTGPREQKALNLEWSQRCTFTTGANSWSKGFDVVLEGRARRVDDRGELGRVASAYREKYGDFWEFEATAGGFEHDGVFSLVFRVEPETVFGFGKGELYSQTRYRFSPT